MDEPLMAYAIASMDGSGFITDASLKIDYIMACYASTQYSQTVLFRDSISSFSKDIQMCSQQWERLPDTMQNNLNKMFSAYFDNVEIIVRLDDASMEDSSNQFKVYIEGIVSQDGNNYQLSKELYVNSKKFSAVSDFSPGNINYA